jgi:hypothetical protein
LPWLPVFGRCSIPNSLLRASWCWEATSPPRHMPRISICLAHQTWLPGRGNAATAVSFLPDFPWHWHLQHMNEQWPEAWRDLLLPSGLLMCFVLKYSLWLCLWISPQGSNRKWAINVCPMEI